MPVRALELFAGIGGGALALKAAGIQTIAYCEIDEWNREVLQHNMRRGRLDAAPIFSDVRTLRGKDLPSKPDIIAGGFPCQGLSAVGKRQGLERDVRSALVQHVYRLVRETKPNYVFLENTPLVARDAGFHRLLDKFRSLGFRCAFVVSSASEVGAAHMRRRWFFLAQRIGAPPLRVSVRQLSSLKNKFRQTVENKVVPRNHSKCKKTCFSFGNSVVPAQALASLELLTRAMRVAVKRLHAVDLASADFRKPIIYENCGSIRQWKDYPLPSSECSGTGFHVYPPQVPSSQTLSSPRIQQSFFSKCMPTARAQVTCAVPGKTMTQRSRADPGNFLLSAREMYRNKKVPHDAERAKLSISDAFWAASFGFPRDWISNPLRNA